MKSKTEISSHPTHTNIGAVYTFEPGFGISNKITSAPIEDSQQLAHPISLIGVLTVHSVDSKWSKASSGGWGRLRLIRLPGPRGYKTFFMLNSAVHENFSANKYENTN